MALLDKLERELKEAQAKVDAALVFSDLEEIKDRWGIVRLCTDDVNEKAIEFEVKPECDCCSGINVYALPYIEYQGIRLYSKTPAVSFSKKYTSKELTFYMAEDNWDESAEWQEFNGLLLDKVAEWLDDHDADPYENDVYDEDDDYEEIEEIEDDPQ